MIDVDQVAQRLDRRDGQKIIAYREVGLPLFRLNCLVTLQETGRLGAVEEFTLRAVKNGINEISDIQQFLGLPEKIISAQVAELVFEGHLEMVRDASGQYSLTIDGARRVSVAHVSQIIREQMPLYMDGITRKLAAVDPRELWNSKQLDALGISALSPLPRRIPKAADVDVADINRVIGLMAKLDRPALRASRVDAVLGRPALLFRRAVAIVFKSDDARKISIAYAVDGRESLEHEVEFARAGGVEKSVIFKSLLDSDKRRREIQVVAREMRKDFVGGLSPDPVGTRRPVLAMGPVNQIVLSPTTKFRTLSVYEHPPLLRQAMESAKERLLIVSPWIRSAVVDKNFIRRLSSCLDRGVNVAIAFGIAKRDPNEKEADQKAREALEALASTFPNFSFVRKGDTHAKILLVDRAFFITTSFNWLSFRGDANQPMREEEGTMVSDADAVEAYYQKLMSRIQVET